MVGIGIGGKEVGRDWIGLWMWGLSRWEVGKARSKSRMIYRFCRAVTLGGVRVGWGGYISNYASGVGAVCEIHIYI